MVWYGSKTYRTCIETQFALRIWFMLEAEMAKDEMREHEVA